MINYTLMLPEMLTGNELIEELSVIPEYDSSIKNDNANKKLIALSNIYDVYIPSKMSVEIYNKLYLSLYHSLQKKSSQLATRQKYENYKKILSRPSNSIIGGSDSFTIIGTSGIGKSTAINRAVDVITNNCVFEYKLKSKIIPFITVQCPFDSSVKGLAIEILLKIDSILETGYCAQQNFARCTVDILVAQICTIAINNIGVLIVDEIQNVVNSKNGKNIIGFLTQLINNSGISICMVGTPESMVYFESAAHLARRTMGLKYSNLKYDKYFKNIIDILLKYQYTKTQRIKEEEVYRWIYEHSSGNISIIISLLHDAQEIAIVSGKDILNANVLNEAFENRIGMFHKYIKSFEVQYDDPKNKKMFTINTECSNNFTEENTIKSIFLFSKDHNKDFIEELKNNGISIEEVLI